MHSEKDAVSHGLQLPWWKRIVLDKAYRERVMALTAERYREEMSLLQNYPHQLAPAVWDDGTPIFASAQYICVDDNTAEWATTHPASVVEASSFCSLRTAAAAVAIPGRNEEEKAAHILDEVRLIYDNEKPEDRLYGLSYIWDRQLPPHGFIRVWPEPLSAMWPSMLASSSSSSLLFGGAPKLSPAEAAARGCTTDPTAVHVYRRNGEFLGIWRQSQLLIRYKVVCWAMHEEERRRTCSVVDRCFSTVSGVHSNASSSDLLEEVPVFEVPLLRLQRGRANFSTRTRRVDVRSLKSPTTWEGIAPGPPMYRAAKSYTNWHALHGNSALVSQAVRDVYDMLPQNEAGLLTKVTYVEFVLDLLNLFFPTHANASSLAIAEEEWVYRGTTELVSFQTFYEKFFSFPFIFLRDISTVTREEYVEVWVLIRVCLLEDKDTILRTLICSGMRMDLSSVNVSPCCAGNMDNTHSLSSLGGIISSWMEQSYGAKTLGSTMHPIQEAKTLQRRDPPPLVCGITGIPLTTIIKLAERNFHNTNNYPLYRAKQALMAMAGDTLRWVPPSRRIAILHAKSQRLVARDLRERQRQEEAYEEEEEEEEKGQKLKLMQQQQQQQQQEEQSEEMLNTESDGGGGGGDRPFKMNDPTTSLASIAFSASDLHSELNDTMFKRRCALEQVEAQQQLQKVLDTSIMYQKHSQRLHGMHARALTHICANTSSWMLHKQDVYELPPESVDGEDALIAFVRDLPDEFFNDKFPLRVRYGVYEARLSDRADKRMPYNMSSTTRDLTLSVLSETMLEAAAHGLASVTSNPLQTPSSSASFSSSSGSRGGPDGTRRRKWKHSAAHGRLRGKRVLSSLHSKSSKRVQLEKKESLLMRPVQMMPLQLHGSPVSLPSLSITGRWTPSPSPSSSLASLPSTTKYNCGTREPRSISASSPEKKRPTVTPRRALHIRLQFKRDLDLRYAKERQLRPNRLPPFSFARTTKQKSASPVRGGGVNAKSLLPM